MYSLDIFKSENHLTLQSIMSFILQRTRTTMLRSLCGFKEDLDVLPQLECTQNLALIRLTVRLILALKLKE